MALNLNPNTNLLYRRSRRLVDALSSGDSITYDADSPGAVGSPQPVYLTDRTDSSGTSGSIIGSSGTSAGRSQDDTPLTPDRIDDAPLQRNMQAIEAHINWDHYCVPLPPDRWQTSLTAETAIFTPTTSARAGSWAFPDDSITRVYTNIRPRSQWTTGKFKVTVYYTADGGSTNTFRFFFNLFSALYGIALDTAMTTNVNQIVSLAGPATAFVPVEYTFYTTTSMPPGTRILGASMGRIGADAADTNVNNLLIADTQMEFVSAQIQAHR